MFVVALCFSFTSSLCHFLVYFCVDVFVGAVVCVGARSSSSSEVTTDVIYLFLNIIVPKMILFTLNVAS